MNPPLPTPATMGLALLLAVASCTSSGDPSVGNSGAGGAAADPVPTSGSGGNSGNGRVSGSTGAGGSEAGLAGTGRAGTGGGGAGDGGAAGMSGGGGSTSTAGAAGAGGTGSGAGGTSVTADAGTTSGSASNLPIPSSATHLPKPTGMVANLKVLAWAGFKGAATYTFDDSQPSQIAHWPDLKATGVPVTFYITTTNHGLAGYDATWKDAEAAGAELGNHTVNHCNFDLSGCATHLATAEAEIDQCSDYLKTNLGAPDVWTMAYPFGDGGYSSDAQARFFLARGTSDALIAAGDTTDPFNLPVKAAAGGESASVFSSDIDSARSQGKWVIFLFHSLLPGDNWYAGVDIGTVTGSIDHAKSLADMWIGTVVDVGAYWLGQKAFEAAPPKVSNGASTWQWTLPPHFPKGKFLRVIVDGGTLTQGKQPLAWDSHGYYEVSLDQGSLGWAP